MWHAMEWRKIRTVLVEKLEEMMRLKGNMVRTGVESNTHKFSAEKLEERMRWAGMWHAREWRKTYRISI
jgi:hypothetical protein